MFCGVFLGSTCCGGTGANIHDVIERQLPSKVAHYSSICGKNNDCDMNDAQLDCACVTSSLFGALNAQLVLRDKIQTHSSMLSKIRIAHIKGE